MNHNSKVTAQEQATDSTISSYNSTGLTIGEEVVIASGYQNAISIGAEGVALNPLFHWKYKTAPVAGKLVIKADGVEKATFTTDGKLKSFGIGGVIGKEYTVYYTPDGGTEKAQQDADGTTAFKADANGLMEYSGMMESTGVGALNLSTLTGDAILTCTDGKWKYVLDEDGATELPFSGVIKGGSKDTELAFEHGLLIRKRVNGAERPHVRQRQPQAQQSYQIPDRCDRRPAHRQPQGQQDYRQRLLTQCRRSLRPHPDTGRPQQHYGIHNRYR